MPAAFALQKSSAARLIFDFCGALRSRALRQAPRGVIFEAHVTENHIFYVRGETPLTTPQHVSKKLQIFSNKEPLKYRLAGKCLHFSAPNVHFR